MEDLRYGTDITFINLSDATQILNSTVVPRPIAFVSTLSAENKPNLAPFRYGTCLGRIVFRSEPLTVQSMCLPTQFFSGGT